MPSVVAALMEHDLTTSLLFSPEVLATDDRENKKKGAVPYFFKYFIFLLLADRLPSAIPCSPPSVSGSPSIVERPTVLPFITEA